MPDDQIKRKRGRPRKIPINVKGQDLSSTSELSSDNNSDTSTSYEFNSFYTPSSTLLFSSLFNCGIYDFFRKEEIECVFRDPIFYHDVAIVYQTLFIPKMVLCPILLII